MISREEYDAQRQAELQKERIALMDKLRRLRVTRLQTAGRNFSNMHRKNIEQDFEDTEAELEEINRLITHAKESA